MRPRRFQARVMVFPSTITARSRWPCAVAGKSRKHLLVASFSYFDPKRTFRLNHLNKGAIKWTRLLCRSFAANAVRLQLHALAYNLGNFLRTLATPEPIEDWSLTSLKEKLIEDLARGREPGPLCHVPDGRSRRSQKSLRRHPTNDRRTSTAARSRACVKCSVVMRSSQTQGRDTS